MATTSQIELSELYNKDKYKVVNQRSEDKEGEIRCRRATQIPSYVEKLRTALETLDEVTIMGAGKAVPSAATIGEIARNIQPNLHLVVTKGKEDHSFVFAKVDDEEEQITKQREVEYIRIRVIKDSKVTDEDKKSEGYTAPPESVTEESLAEAVKQARSAQSNRRTTRSSAPRRARKTPEEGATPAVEGEAAAAAAPRRRGPQRRRNSRKTTEVDGEAAPPTNRRRGPRRQNQEKREAAAAATAPAATA